MNIYYIYYIFYLLFLLINSGNTINNNIENNIENTDQDDWDNATWVLTSSFIIITMQSGFGLLESGLVSNKINIL
jgi:hypothetical protein